MYVASSVYVVPLDLFLLFAMLLVCMGYGRAFLSALKVPACDRHWLAAVSGMSGLMLLGGVFALFGVISEYLNYFLIYLGIVLFLYFYRNNISAFFVKRPWQRYNAATWAVLFFAVVLLSSRVFSAFFPHWINLWDDLPPYFHFPKRMLETGGFIEPFSFRKLPYLGGAQYLQTFLYPILSVKSIALIDAGLGPVLIFMTLMDFGAGKTGNTDSCNNAVKAILATVLLYGLVYHNNTFNIIPIAIMLSMLKYVSDEAFVSDRKSLVVLSLLSAALVSTRNNYFLFVALCLAPFLLFKERTNVPGGLKYLSGLACLTALMLSPWMSVSYLSNATPFWPLIRGDNTALFGAGLTKSLSVGEQAAFVFNNFLSTNFPVVLIFCIYTAAVHRDRKPLFALAAGMSFLLAALSLSLTASDTWSIRRYFGQYQFAFVIFLLDFYITGVLGDNWLRRHGMYLGILLIFLSAWVFLPSECYLQYKINPHTTESYSKTIYQNAKKSLESLFTLSSRIDRFHDDTDRFEIAQSLMENGAKVAAVVRHTYKLDFRKQHIDAIDSLGVANPPPGIPYFKGSRALLKYFKDLNYRYILYSDFRHNNGFNSYYYWKNVQNRRDDFIDKIFAPYYVDFFENLIDIEKSGLVAASVSDLKIIDLTSIPGL